MNQTIESNLNKKVGAAEGPSRWAALRERLRGGLDDARQMFADPKLSISLMHAATHRNDPFYRDLVETFYRDARRPHPKCPIIRRRTRGVAVCELPHAFDEYFMKIDAAARRNFKKSLRNGFTFSCIQFNDFLDDVARIRASAEFRQGRVPDSLLRGPVSPAKNPPSLEKHHDFLYFGIQRDGILYAYASCFVAGELCNIEHILGDANYQADGIVPMLIISIAGYLLEHHPSVKYYAYDTYYGAREPLRRFKRKFGFLPHRVSWRL